VSSLYVIRHGQASYWAKEYDVLSDLGEAQSQRLGAFWAGRQLAIDAVYCGPRKRHRDTAAKMLHGAAKCGFRLPEPTVMPELDEYPAHAIMRVHMPEAVQERPHLTPLLQGMGSKVPDDDRREFMQLFEELIERWGTGDLQVDGEETYEQFSQRVEGALKHIISEQGRGKRVMVVTSAGPVSVAMRMALQLDVPTTMRTGWVVANSSVTELRYRSTDSMGLISFNGLPHLRQHNLISYR